MEKLKLKNLIKLGSILYCIVMVQACNKIRIKNYFLPKDFEGNVAVIYSNNEYPVQNTYDYIIPDNGILKTKYSFNEGDYRINFYQRNQHNGYDTLYEELPSTPYDTSKNRIYFNRILTFKKHGSKNIYTVGTFYIGKKSASDLGKDRFLFEKKLEEIVLAKE